MMIYGRPLYNPETHKLERVEISLDLSATKEFLALLNRALNTVAPELHQDWLLLSDAIEAVLRKQN